MLKRNLLKLSISVGIALLFATLAQAAQNAGVASKSLQIFANGKSYGSFAQYRSDRFKRQMIAAMPEAERVAFDKFLVANKGFSSIDAHEAVDYDRFVGFYDEFRLWRAKPASQPQELTKSYDPLAEMKIMLDDLQAQNREAESITLDPDRMKTVILNKPQQK